MQHFETGEARTPYTVRDGARAEPATNMNADYDEDEARASCDFQDPGGRSALRRAHKGNPRNRTCPTCKTPNALTPRDVQLGYQCNRCADRDEGTFPSGYGEY